MAPSKHNHAPPYAKDEKVLCFHGDLMYEAKIIDIRQTASTTSSTSGGSGGGGNKEGGSSSKSSGGNPADDVMYRVHYKGWKASWDDWVTADRIRKFTDDNKQLASQLRAQATMRTQGHHGGHGKGGPTITGGKKGGGPAGKAGSEMSSARGSEERAAGSSSFAGRGPRRGRDYELESEDAFHARPSVKLKIPDILKAVLVDDWENITKNNQLVPLPHPQPVTKILDDYNAYEAPKRPEGSAQVDILHETLAGLKEYFDKALGRILLYRFERAQYAEVVAKWNSDDPEWEGKKTASDTYGAEHLMRLIVSLPELVAQTNMDQQSVNRLREEMTKITNWLSKNAENYFLSDYENPNSEYTEKAKN